MATGDCAPFVPSASHKRYVSTKHRRHEAAAGAWSRHTPANVGTQKIIEICRAGGYPEPEFVEQAAAVYVRFPAGAYVPPTRISHDLTDRQRKVLAILGNGAQWRVKDILSKLDNPPAKRTLQDDLSLLRSWGLIETSGRGAGSRWWLKQSPEILTYPVPGFGGSPQTVPRTTLDLRAKSRFPWLVTRH